MKFIYTALTALLLFGSLYGFALPNQQTDESGELYLASDDLQIRYSDRSRSIEIFIVSGENDKPLEVVLFDALGNRVYLHRWSPGTYGKTVTGSLDELNSGIFFVRVFYGNRVYTTGITIGAGGV